MSNAGDEELISSLVEEQERLTAGCDGLIQRFVDGTLQPISITEAFSRGESEAERLEKLAFVSRSTPVESVEDTDEKSVLAKQGKWRRSQLNVDTHVLSTAFAWLGSTEALQDELRKPSSAMVVELRDAILSTLPQPDQSSDDHKLSDRPNDFDYWIYDLVARCVCFAEDENEAEALWKPILSLPGFLADWIERFFWSWFGDGVQFTPSPEVYVRRWEPMIEELLSRDDLRGGRLGSRNESEIAFGLLGLRHPTGLLGGSREYAEPLKAIKPTMERAVKRWITHPEVARGFFAILIQPAYQEILCSGVVWISDGIEDEKDNNFWDTRDLQSSLVSVLSVAWTRHSATIARDHSLRQAFEKLLALLTSRGKQAALSLRDRVLDSLPTD